MPFTQVQTRPSVKINPTYLNTPEISVFVKDSHSRQISDQHRLLGNVRGFFINLEGMSVHVSGGVCVFKSGQLIRHEYSKFYVDRLIPTVKSESFYLALSLTRPNTGMAIINLFNHMPDEDWLVLKQIDLPLGSTSLADAIILNKIKKFSHRIYNYFPSKISSTEFLLPYLVDKHSINFYVEGEIAHIESVSVHADSTLIKLSSPVDNSKLSLADFDVLI